MKLFDFDSISSYYFYESFYMEIGVNIIVKGMVQGVGFRYFVYDKALKFGLNGYTRNLYNGDVEIEVTGERSIVEEFIKEVKTGPRASHVSDVKIKWIQPGVNYNNFEIR